MSARTFGCQLVILLLAMAPAARAADAPETPTLERDVLPLLKARCVKCHGPSKREAELNLASPKALARGGENGAAVVPHRPDESLLWERVADGDMPPKEPLPADEKATLLRWIEGGASGLPALAEEDVEAADHWAFAPLRAQATPSVRGTRQARSILDRYIQAALEAKGLAMGQEADRATLARRVSLDLTGVPPTPQEISEFLADASPMAYERMVDHCLASPRYGERWGKFWLDAAGYADSNGYFSADSDRPLAYLYRDYVIRSWNLDKPFDRFLREQIAGDELAGYRRGDPVTPEVRDMLVASHFLRNSQDGTGESDGNPDEVRADRYAVVEGTIEILGSSLFGLTFQCARCHDHKFEPVTQKDYYQLQAILFAAFPLDKWAKPNDRVVDAPLPAESQAWEERAHRLEADLTAAKERNRSWVERNRERGTTLFRDGFDAEPGCLVDGWSPRAPGDSGPMGQGAVNLDSTAAPGALIKNGALQIIESGAAGDRCLSTSMAFDWTPNEVGGWIQATFQLIDRRVTASDAPAERVAYFLATRDFLDQGAGQGGNVLIDGNPAGGAAVHVDYPGADSRAAGTLGAAGYESGHRFGVRVTNEGAGKYRLEHVVDWLPEGKSVTLEASDLPDGGFGFEFCCGRSFIVDNVLIESGQPSPMGSREAVAAKAREAEGKALRDAQEQAAQAFEAWKKAKPGRVAWVAEPPGPPPVVHLLKRGNYNDPGPVVEPGPPAVLVDPANPYRVAPPFPGAASSGRRLALANWFTQPGSRAAALLARVTVNRIWQGHFGVGLVATPENLGYSGSPPSHLELLDHLAWTFINDGWSVKSLHRRIMNSAVYRQISHADLDASHADPENRLLWRYPLRRLDAESVRDAMLAAAGELDSRMGGPYVPVAQAGTGDFKVDGAADGARRRSVYLQQRRTSVVGLLQVFDAPSIVTNCTRRNTTTIPLQSLSLMNSSFVLERSQALAKRLDLEAGSERVDRINRAFLLTLGREPSAEETAAAVRFLDEQPPRHTGRPDAIGQSWADFCQAILASNAFLYVE